jgi:hypothetical protein
MLIDTQIVSYRFKGHSSGGINSSDEISSITVSEFLLFKTQENNKPDYYVLHPNRYAHLSICGTSPITHDQFENAKWAKLGANRTDSFIIDFSNKFSPYKIFGNEAISKIINEKNYNLYKISISHLPKRQQKYLKTRIEFIFDSGYVCHPVTDNIIELSMQLFFQFLQQGYTPKDEEIIFMVSKSLRQLLGWVT